MALMGYREYSRHRGVSLGAVQKAISAGRIHATDNKKIDSDQADRDWEANTDDSRVAVNVIGNAHLAQQQMILGPAAVDTPRTVKSQDDGKDDVEDISGNDRVANEYREHRSTRERYQALKQQLEYEQLVGALINVDEAKRIAFTSFRSLRDAVMNVAPRIKDQLAAVNDPAVVEEILDAELSAALASIDVGKLLSDQDD